MAHEAWSKPEKDRDIQHRVVRSVVWFCRCETCGKETEYAATEAAAERFANDVYGWLLTGTGAYCPACQKMMANEVP